jgi:hypothetical protein
VQVFQTNPADPLLIFSPSSVHSPGFNNDHERKGVRRDDAACTAGFLSRPALSTTPLAGGPGDGEQHKRLFRGLLNPPPTHSSTPITGLRKVVDCLRGRGPARGSGAPGNSSIVCRPYPENVAERPGRAAAVTVLDSFRPPSRDGQPQRAGLSLLRWDPTMTERVRHEQSRERRRGATRL